MAGGKPASKTRRIRALGLVVAVTVALPASTDASPILSGESSSAFARTALFDAGLLHSEVRAPTAAEAAGDLDGDGMQDILVTSQSALPGTAIHDISFAAREARTGDALWSFTSVALDVIALPGRDVSGDGHPDPLLLTLTDTGGTRVSWILSAHSGVSGAPLWSVRGSEAAGVARAALVPMWATDSNEDSVPDIVLNDYVQVRPPISPQDFERGDAIDIYAGVNGYTGAGTALKASVLSGATGAQLYERRAAISGWAALRPLGGPTGSGFLWYLTARSGEIRACPVFCIYPGPKLEGAIFSIESLDRSFSTVWSRQLMDPTFVDLKVQPDASDLDGDGVFDVLVSATLAEPLATRYTFGAGFRLVAISGSNGHDLWNKPTVVATPVIIGAVDGSAGDDVIVAGSHTYEPPSTSPRGTIMQQLDGATGTVLSESTLPRVWGLEEFGDADGDGISDLLVRLGQSAQVRSAASGALLYQTSAFLRGFTAIGDADGDGAADLLTMAHDWTIVQESVTLRAMRVSPGNGGEVIWTAVQRGRRGVTFTARTVLGNSDGTHDLVLSGLQQHLGETQSEAVVLDADEGAETWRAGIFNSAGDPGTLRARVVNEAGDPLGRMCLTARADEETATNTSTNSVGVASFTTLPAGVWKLFIRDCGPLEYASQWYDGADDESEATPIAVTSGAETEVLVTMRAVLGPPNDRFEDAIDLVAGSDQQDATYAQIEAGEPTPCGIQRTTWYRFERPLDGSVVVTTGGSGVRSAIAVYRGTSLIDLESLGCNASPQYPVAFGAITVEVARGETYFVQVGSRDGERGPLRISVAFYPSKED